MPNKEDKQKETPQELDIPVPEKPKKKRKVKSSGFDQFA